MEPAESSTARPYPPRPSAVRRAEQDARTRSLTRAMLLVGAVTVAGALLLWSQTDRGSSDESNAATAADVTVAATQTTSAAQAPPSTQQDRSTPTSAPTTTPTAAEPTPSSVAAATPLGQVAVPIVGSSPPSPDAAPTGTVVGYVYDDTVKLSGAAVDTDAIQRMVAFTSAGVRTPRFVVDDITVQSPADGTLRLVDLATRPFPSGRATLSAERAEALDRVIQVMDRYPAVSLVVTGHGDASGDDPDDPLGRARALAEVTYLEAHGIDRGRLTVGAPQEATTGSTLLDAALARRTELTFSGVLDTAVERPDEVGSS